MNWDIVKWVAGTLLTCAGIKFVWTAFRALFSKENMESAMSGIGTGIANLGKRAGNAVKNKIDERKKEDECPPKIYIR